MAAASAACCKTHRWRFVQALGKRIRYSINICISDLWSCLWERFCTSLFWRSGKEHNGPVETPLTPRSWSTGALKGDKTNEQMRLQSVCVGVCAWERETEVVREEDRGKEWIGCKTQSTITKYNDRLDTIKLCFSFFFSQVSCQCAFKSVRWWVSNDRVWIILSACHSAGGVKECFQAYLLQACVTNDCFVPLTQWGGLSQASLSSLAGVWVLASWHMQKFDTKRQVDNIFMNIWIRLSFK